jgi:hypothetical protein
MSGMTQITSEAEDMILYAPWHVEGIGAYDPHAQRVGRACQ